MYSMQNSSADGGSSVMLMTLGTCVTPTGSTVDGMPQMYMAVAGHGAAPNPEYWQQMSLAHSAEAAHLYTFVPSYSDQPVLGYAGLPSHVPWQQVAPYTSLNSGDCLPQPGQVYEMPSVVPAPFVVDLADCLGRKNGGLETPPAMDLREMTPPATGCCTPEITPRYAYEAPLSMPVDLQEVLAKLAETAEFPEHAQCEEHSSVAKDPEFVALKEGGVDAFSECDSSDDEKDHVCWDFDSRAAMLIRAQRDSKSYASSETSTAVSQSSRRRRGRRVAKSKARSSMVILESPPVEDVLVNEGKKAELICQLETGGVSMHRAVASLIGSVLQMSLEPFGCRVIQAALDLASNSEKETMAAELHGHVRLVTSSPHANFVIQKVIEVLPVGSTGFVAEELATVAADVAQHRFGCRVLSRLVEHHLCGETACPSTNKLIDELLRETDQLIRHNFARHVLELILEHGSEAHRHRIAAAIQSNACYYAKNRCASYVIEKALVLCSAPDTNAIVSTLLADSKQFLALAVHECGMHVVRAAIRANTELSRNAMELLLEDAQHVQSSKYGKRLLDEVGGLNNC